MTSMNTNDSHSQNGKYTLNFMSFYTELILTWVFFTAKQSDTSIVLDSDENRENKTKGKVQNVLMIFMIFNSLIVSCIKKIKYFHCLLQNLRQNQ